mgnify:CR=1 FL=1
MDNMEYIDDYFNRSNTAEQKEQFEQRIVRDISFAEEVAFYISTHEVIKDQLQIEKKQRFRAVYEQQKTALSGKRPVRQMWKYAVAACTVAVIAMARLLFSSGTSPKQLADDYVQQNWETLDIAMSAEPDSLQTGLALFNTGKMAPALLQFETILERDSANFMAKEYAGIAALRLSQYDKALFYFSALASDTTLHSNPGRFYQAIALLKRGGPADTDMAKKLLQEVAANDLEGSKEAKQWLKKLD